MMVSRMREAGETVFSVCSACVSQLMKSCRELWKSVASSNASSSLTCDGRQGENNIIAAKTGDKESPGGASCAKRDLYSSRGS